MNNILSRITIGADAMPLVIVSINFSGDNADLQLSVEETSKKICIVKKHDYLCRNNFN